MSSMSAGDCFHFDAIRVVWATSLQFLTLTTRKGALNLADQLQEISHVCLDPIARRFMHQKEKTDPHKNFP